MILKYFRNDKIKTTVDVKKDSASYKEIITYALLGLGIFLILRYVDISLSNPIDVCTKLYLIARLYLSVSTLMHM